MYHLGPKFQEIRESYLKGETPDFVFDLRNLQYSKQISIAALTAFLSNSKRMSDFLGFPIPAILNWDPELQGFLADIGFFDTSEKHKIFNWGPANLIGGFHRGKTNPFTKILHYSDIQHLKTELDLHSIGKIKAILKQRIAPNFLMRCSGIFQGFDDKLEAVLSNTALELIVNSLIHAEDIAFVSVQRTSTRITISVCDSGIGFSKSLKRTFKKHRLYESLSNEDAILTGCLVQKNEHGLRLAISEVLNYKELSDDDENEGWVIISSYDTEVRWQKKNWRKSIEYFDTGTNYQNPKIQEIMGPSVKDFIERSKVEEGYWRKYESYLIGTRITFEIIL